MMSSDPEVPIEGLRTATRIVVVAVIVIALFAWQGPWNWWPYFIGLPALPIAAAWAQRHLLDRDETKRANRRPPLE